MDRKVSEWVSHWVNKTEGRCISFYSNLKNLFVADMSAKFWASRPFIKTEKKNPTTYVFFLLTPSLRERRRIWDKKLQRGDELVREEFETRIWSIDYVVKREERICWIDGEWFSWSLVAVPRRILPEPPQKINTFDW